MNRKTSAASCFFTLCISLCLLLFTLYARSGQALFTAENLINFIFLTIMTVLMLFVIGISIGKMRRVIHGLQSANNRIELGDKPRKADFAASPELQEAHEKYRTELYDLKRIRRDAPDSETVSCDIEDFINSDLLDHIIRKPVCDSVSGFMTGFGMLGTFGRFSA